MSKSHYDRALLFYHGFSAHQACDLLSAKFHYYCYLKSERKNPDVWYLVGLCHLELKEWAAAYFSLRRALRLDSRSSVYWAGLALYYAVIQKSHLAFYCCKHIENREDLLKQLSSLIAIHSAEAPHKHQVVIYH